MNSGKRRHDPTRRLNRNDSRLNFSPSSQYCVIEIFLKGNPDFMLYMFLFQMWLEVERTDSFPLSGPGQQSWGNQREVGDDVFLLNQH